MQQQLGYRCIFSWSIHSIALQAEWILDISPVNANMQQWLTMWSMVCWSWPHSHLAVSLMRPFVHQMPASDAADGGPLASMKITPGKYSSRVRDKILLSDVC